jgi:hypothetical protein
VDIVLIRPANPAGDRKESQTLMTIALDKLLSTRRSSSTIGPELPHRRD